MHVFNIIWLRWLLVLLGGGLVLFLLLYLGFVPSYQRPKGEPMEEYPAGIQVGSRPVPALLLLFFSLVVACMVGYLAYVWSSGVSY
ncbi:MAG: hypothetical protein ACE149_09845 [Armatimonadota bacterium]